VKIPKKINIMGHEYKIEMTTPKEFAGLKNQDSHVQIMSNGEVGECEYPTRIIRLSKAVIGKLQYYTLLHEIRHAYQFETGLPQIMTHQVLELDAESFVSLISSLKAQKVI
jgi:hypothetical protein